MQLETEWWNDINYFFQRVKQIWNNFYVISLKELQNCIPLIIRVWSLFSSIRVYKSPHFLPVLLENYSFVFLSFLCFLPALFRIDVISINFLTLHNHCLHSSRCRMLCVFVKNLSIALNKKHVSRELLRKMWNIHKLKGQQNAISKFKKWRLCCGPLV